MRSITLYVTGLACHIYGVTIGDEGLAQLGLFLMGLSLVGFVLGWMLP